MYINPFWCGVGATVLVEFIAMIILIALASRKK